MLGLSSKMWDLSLWLTGFSLVVMRGLQRPMVFSKAMFFPSSHVWM